ncbi:MAG: hypothetical protein P4L99_01315 [Chthoniobacter sp.]|nr:hypothetical protein [Chthoniobacter sp.]
MPQDFETLRKELEQQFENKLLEIEAKAEKQLRERLEELTKPLEEGVARKIVTDEVNKQLWLKAAAAAVFFGLASWGGIWGVYKYMHDQIYETASTEAHKGITEAIEKGKQDLTAFHDELTKEYQSSLERLGQLQRQEGAIDDQRNSIQTSLNDLSKKVSIINSPDLTDLSAKVQLLKSLDTVDAKGQLKEFQAAVDELSRKLSDRIGYKEINIPPPTTLPESKETINVPIPPSIPENASEVLVFCFVYSGTLPIEDDFIEVSTIDKNKRMNAYRLFFHPFLGNMTEYNSDYFWLPMPRDRTLQAKYTNSFIPKDHGSARIQIWGYR